MLVTLNINIELFIFFLLGLLFGYNYLSQTTNIYRAPSAYSVTNKLINHMGRCYRLKPVVYICPISYSMAKAKDIK